MLVEHVLPERIVAAGEALFRIEELLSFDASRETVARMRRPAQILANTRDVEIKRRATVDAVRHLGRHRLKRDANLEASESEGALCKSSARWSAVTSSR